MRLAVRRDREHWLYLALAILMLLFYVYAAFLSRRQDSWGFNQLKHMGLPAVLVVLLLSGAAAGVTGRLCSRKESDKGPSPYLTWTSFVGYSIVALAFLALFWYLRSNFVNWDGYGLAYKLPRDVPVRGAHLKHDEMLELWVHSRFWYYANLRLGWTVFKSYQFLSSLSGGAAVFLLLMLARMIQRERSWWLFLLMVSCGFMQLFFGDVENYTLVSTLMLLYLLVAGFCIQGKVSVVAPSIVLAVAICFHVVAASLGPSLLYLYVYVLARNRQGYREIAKGVLLAVLIIVATVATFHFSGALPIGWLSQSHLVGGGQGILTMLVTPSLQYYWEVVNLLFLLFPTALLVPLLAMLRRIDTQPMGVFLLLAAIPQVLSMLVWNAGLGVYQDWNLFAPGAMCVALLCFYNLLRIPDLRHRELVYSALFLVSALHTYNWIVSNHFFHL